MSTKRGFSKTLSLAIAPDALPLPPLFVRKGATIRKNSLKKSFSPTRDAFRRPLRFYLFLSVVLIQRFQSDFDRGLVQADVLNEEEEDRRGGDTRQGVQREQAETESFGQQEQTDEGRGDRLRQHGRGVIQSGKAADFFGVAEFHDHRERVDVDQTHAEAFYREDGVDIEREGAVGGYGQAQDEPHGVGREGQEEPGGQSPFTPDLGGDDTAYDETDDAHQTADDGIKRQGRRGRQQVVPGVVGHKSADSVIRHEPEELRQKDQNEHGFVGFGQRGVLFDRVFYLRLFFPGDQVVFYLLFDLVLFDEEEEYQDRHDHQNGRQEERYLDDPDVMILPRTGVFFAQILREDQKQSEQSGHGAADITHDIDDAVGFAAQRLRGQVGHQRHRRVAVHHGKEDRDRHQHDQRGQAVVVERDRHKREHDGARERPDQNVGHSFADPRVGFVG